MRRYDLRLDLDLRCNFSCAYCPNPRLAKSEKERLRIDLLQPLWQELNNHCWSLYLSCAGEPTLHPQFDHLLQEIGRYLTRPDLSIVTNALLLNQQHRQAIFDSRINRILVSLDTLDEELFARLCGVTSQQARLVQENTLLFAREREKRKNPPHLIITSIAMRSTLDGLPEVAQ